MEIQSQETAEGTYKYYLVPKTCSKCRNAVRGIHIEPDIEHDGGSLCLNCSVIGAVEASRNGVRKARNLESIDLLTHPALTDPLLLLGNLVNLPLFLQVSRIGDGLRREITEKRTAENFILLLGYSVEHPLAKVLRNFSYLQIREQHQFFLPHLLRLAEGMHELIVPPVISLRLLRYNLAKLLAVVALYRDETQHLIRKALQEAKQVGDEYVDGWFGFSSGIYIPKYSDHKKTPSLENLLPLAALSSSKGMKAGAERMHESRQTSELTLDPRLLERQLDAAFLLPALKKIYSHFLADIHQRNSALFSNLRSGVKPSQKSHYAAVFALILSDSLLVRKFFSSLPGWLKALLTEAIWGERIFTLEELYRRAGQILPVVDRNHYSFGKSAFELPGQLSFFKLIQPIIANYHVHGPILFGALDQSFANILIEQLDPPAYCMPAGAEKPADSLMVSSNFPAILRQLPAVLSFCSQFRIERSQDGTRILKSSLKQTEKIFTIDEPYSEVKELEHLRRTLLIDMAETLGMVMSGGKGGTVTMPTEEMTTPESMAETVFRVFFHPDSPFVKETALFFHKELDYLKQYTWGRAFPPHLLFDKAEREVLLELLGQIEPGSWISVDNLYAARTLLWQNHPGSVGQQEENYRWSEFSFMTNFPSPYGSSSARTNLNRQIRREAYFLPQLKAILFALSTIGVVDAACAEPANEYFQAKRFPWLSRFDGLREVALTPLGTWLLGKSDHLEETVEIRKAKVQLDEQRLLVHVSGEDPLVTFTLAQFGIPVGRGCYQMKPELMLKECSSAAEVEARIALFRTNISGTLPAVWEEFFSSLLDGAGQIACDSRRFYSFTVRPDSEKLIGLLFTDPVLREKVVKAEDYRIFVLARDYQAVEKRLAELGYILFADMSGQENEE